VHKSASNRLKGRSACRISSSLFSFTCKPTPSQSSFHKHDKEELIPVSFPDVKGTLTPTVTAAFVDAAPTIWRIKISTFTHKTFSKDNRCNAGFLSSYILSQLQFSLHKHSQPTSQKQETLLFFAFFSGLMSQ